MRAHVIVLIGHSPAVVTELIWWLIIKQKLEIVTVEAWGTSSAQEHALADYWRELRKWLKKHHNITLCESPKICRLRDADGEPLEDITTVEQAHAVTDTLSKRVFDLRERSFDLLIGGLSGGRVSMSTALMTAFGAHSEPQDKLYHIWLHPKIDDALRIARRSKKPLDYPFPKKRFENISPKHQLIGYEVPYVRLRAVVSDPSFLFHLDKPASMETLAHWEGVPAKLEATSHRKWYLHVGGDRAKKILIGQAQATVYWLLIVHPSITIKELYQAYQDQHPEVWYVWSPSYNTFKRTASKLFETLRKHKDLPESLNVERIKQGLYQVRGASAVECDLSAITAGSQTDRK